MKKGKVNRHYENAKEAISEKLSKKLIDTEKEINKRRMLSSCFYKEDCDSIALSGTNRSSKQSSGTSGYYSMLPSARERIESQHCFKNSYNYHCEINNTVPKVKVQQDQVLEFYGDRIRFEDWIPIIKAIESDLSLRIIKIKNRNLIHPGFTRDPALCKRKILSLLIAALQKCLSQSKMLNVIHLEAIPFSQHNLKILFNRFENNDSLQHIELPCCSLGNKGCEMLCRILRYKTNIKSLDLTSCGITQDGATYISELIQVQKLIRFSDCWKQSLRYRQPNPSASSGLLKIVLHNNVNLEDSGFACIASALYDDLWITEIHCQNCGLTNVSAEEAIKLAKSNYFIKFIDIRRNLSVDPDLVNALEKLLTVNNASVPLQGSWYRQSEFNEPVRKNNKMNSRNNSSNLKTSSGYSCPSNKDSNSSIKLSRNSDSLVTVNVPPLRISHIHKNHLARKAKPTNQKISELQQTKNDLKEVKARLFDEISERMALEKYCKHLEMQLQDKDNYVSIEKSLLVKLIQTFQEFSLALTNAANTENKSEDDPKPDFDCDNIPNLKKGNFNPKNLKEKEEKLTKRSNLCSSQTASKINLDANCKTNPMLRAQELFCELLKKSS